MQIAPNFPGSELVAKCVGLELELARGTGRGAASVVSHKVRVPGRLARSGVQKNLSDVRRATGSQAGLSRGNRLAPSLGPARALGWHGGST